MDAAGRGRSPLQCMGDRQTDCRIQHPQAVGTLSGASATFLPPLRSESCGALPWGALSRTLGTLGISRPMQFRTSQGGGHPVAGERWSAADTLHAEDSGGELWCTFVVWGLHHPSIPGPYLKHKELWPMAGKGQELIALLVFRLAAVCRITKLLICMSSSRHTCFLLSGSMVRFVQSAQWLVCTSSYVSQSATTHSRREEAGCCFPPPCC